MTDHVVRFLEQLFLDQVALWRTTNGIGACQWPIDDFDIESGPDDADVFVWSHRLR